MTEAAPLSDPVSQRLRFFFTWAAENRVPLHELQESFRLGYVLTALELESGNQSKAARRVDIHRNTLRTIVGDVLPPDPRGAKFRKARA